MANIDLAPLEKMVRRNARELSEIKRMINELGAKMEETQAKRFYSAKEVASMLSVSYPCVLNYIKTGKIGATQIQGRVLISHSSYRHFVNTNNIKQQ